MIILSHRGYWKLESEKNKPIAFDRSFSQGFGTETDIRDYRGKLVISHDIADDNSMQLSEFFELYKSFDSNLPLALNIKSNGLQHALKNLLMKYGISNYFVFDMSVPDGLQYIAHNLISYSRQSEYELQPSFYQQARGIWLDEFERHWIKKSILNEHLVAGKKICIVSPDLHNRKYEIEWREYKNFEQSFDVIDIMLCTDHPEKARLFFNG